VVCINTWFEQQGYLTWSSSARKVAPHWMELSDPADYYHLKPFDMSRTLVYAPSASSNGLDIRRKETSAPGGAEAAGP